MKFFNSAWQCFVWYCLLILGSSVTIESVRLSEENLLHTTLSEMRSAYDVLKLSSSDNDFMKQVTCFFNDTADVLLTHGHDHPDFVVQCYHFSRGIRSFVQDHMDVIKNIQPRIDLFRKWIIEYAAHHQWWHYNNCSLRSFTSHTRETNTNATDNNTTSTTDNSAEVESTQSQGKRKFLTYPVVAALSVCGGCVACYVIGKAFSKSPSSIQHRGQSAGAVCEELLQKRETSLLESEQGDNGHVENEGARRFTLKKQQKRPPALTIPPGDDAENSKKKVKNDESTYSATRRSHAWEKPLSGLPPTDSGTGKADKRPTSIRQTKRFPTQTLYQNSTVLQVTGEKPKVPFRTTSLVPVKKMEEDIASLTRSASLSEQCKNDIIQLEKTFREQEVVVEQIWHAVTIKEKLATLGRKQSDDVEQEYSHDLTVLNAFQADAEYDELRWWLHENLKLKIACCAYKSKKETTQGGGKGVALSATTQNVLNHLETIKIQTTELIIDFFGLVDPDIAIPKLNKPEQDVLRKLLYQDAKITQSSAGGIACELIKESYLQARIETIFTPLIEMGVDTIKALFERLPKKTEAGKAGFQYDETDILGFFVKQPDERQAFLSRPVHDVLKESVDEQIKALSLQPEQDTWRSRFEEHGLPREKIISLKPFFEKALSDQDKHILCINLGLKKWAYRFIGKNNFAGEMININNLNAPDRSERLKTENTNLFRLIVEKLVGADKRDRLEYLCQEDAVLELLSYTDFEASGMSHAVYIKRIQDILSMSDDLIRLYSAKDSGRRIELLKLDGMRAIETALSNRPK